MGYAFISYSTKNQASADAMRNLFKKHNIDTWMAPYDIPAGSKYAAVITKAIRECSCFVLLLSNDSQASEAVDSEVELAALTFKKSIITVELEKVVLNDSFTFYIHNKQIIAMHKIDENSLEVKQVLDAVRAYTKESEVDTAKDDMSNENIVSSSSSEEIQPKENTSPKPSDINARGTTKEPSLLSTSSATQDGSTSSNDETLVVSTNGKKSNRNGYEYLTKWIKANIAECVFRTHVIEKNGFKIHWHSLAEDYFTVECRISLSDSLALRIYSNIETHNQFTYMHEAQRNEGSFDAKKYTRNSVISFKHGRNNREYLLKKAKCGINLCIEFLQNFLLENNIPVTIADLGFESFEFEEIKTDKIKEDTVNQLKENTYCKPSDTNTPVKTRGASSLSTTPVAQIVSTSSSTPPSATSTSGSEGSCNGYERLTWWVKTHCTEHNSRTYVVEANHYKIIWNSLYNHFEVIHTYGCWDELVLHIGNCIGKNRARFWLSLRGSSLTGSFDVKSYTRNSAIKIISSNHYNSLEIKAEDAKNAVNSCVEFLRDFLSKNHLPISISDLGFESFE